MGVKYNLLVLALVNEKILMYFLFIPYKISMIYKWEIKSYIWSNNYIFLLYGTNVYIYYKHTHIFFGTIYITCLEFRTFSFRIII